MFCPTIFFVQVNVLHLFNYKCDKLLEDKKIKKGKLTFKPDTLNQSRCAHRCNAKLISKELNISEHVYCKYKLLSIKISHKYFAISYRWMFNKNICQICHSLYLILCWFTFDFRHFPNLLYITMICSIKIVHLHFLF